MPAVVLRSLGKTYRNQRGNDVAALRDLTLDVADGELLVLAGPSGSGKTTALRLIAGLETPDTGSIDIDHCPMAGVPPERRGVAMVFQDHPLFPHLSVAENLALALRLRRVARSEIEQRVREVSGWLGLESLLPRPPDSLSGGERQRVALGAALVKQPRLLLLDEPLAHLDPGLRLGLRTQLRQVQAKLRLTTLLVTHDQEEAMALGDRLAVLHRGEIQQLGTPIEVYQRPANTFVAGFIGSPPMNLVPGEWRGSSDSPIWAADAGLRLSLGSEASSCPVREDRLLLGLRPEALRFMTEGATEPEWVSFSATVEEVEPLGPETWIRVQSGLGKLVLRMPPDSLPRAGSNVTVAFRWENALWFDEKTGRRC